MYNHPKLGSFLDLKTKTRSINITKKSARELYTHATDALLLDNIVYFIIDVTWFEKGTLMQEPMSVAKIMVQVSRDTSTTATIMRATSFHYSSLEHPDYSSDHITELKGSYDNFKADWLGEVRH